MTPITDLFPTVAYYLLLFLDRNTLRSLNSVFLLSSQWRSGLGRLGPKLANASEDLTNESPACWSF